MREYLVNAQGKANSLVHQAIRKTLVDRPDEFSILNGGMVIVARGAEVDDKRKVLLLQRPSIINGSQTQGELARYFEKYAQGENFFEPNIKFELIVTKDDDLIAEISISRNFQNDVRAISIAGRRGRLDELEAAGPDVHTWCQAAQVKTDLATRRRVPRHGEADPGPVRLDADRALRPVGEGTPRAKFLHTARILAA